MARTLVENDARVFIASRSLETLKRTAARLTAAGPGSCTPLAADVSSEAGCVALATALRDQGVSSLDVLVNNSGVSWGAPIESFPEDAFARSWAMNVAAPFFLTRTLLPLLRAAPGPARVVNVGSVVGVRAQPVGTYAYDASKAALHHLTTKLAAELAPAVTVNAIAPGYVPTRMSRGFLSLGYDAAGIARAVPMRRLGSASDMGGALLYLASPAGEWVTGTVMVVDGGSLAQPLTLFKGEEEYHR